MDNSLLKKKAFSSVAWAGSIQFISQIVNFALGIILARLLTPNDFGLMAMVLVFTGISQLLTDFGLSSSLIQKDKVEKNEAFTCFVINFLIGLLFTIVLVLNSENISNFYNEPKLTILVIVLAPIFLLNSICSVPNALMARELQHKKIALIEMGSLLLGTIVAVILAFSGLGIWSLVAQQFIRSIVKAFLLTLLSKFKLEKFDFNTISSLLNFSINVFFTRLIQQISEQTDKIIVGRYIGTTDLGFYSRAFHLTTFPIYNITRVVGNVMFPALSKIKHDVTKIGQIYLRLVGIISVLTFPILVGFAVLSESIILSLLGEQWLPMKPYFIFFSLTSMLASIGQISGSFYLSQGRADIHLKLNLFTQPLKIVLLIIGIQWGMIGVLVSYAVSVVVGSFGAFFTLSHILGIRVREILFSMLIPAFASLIMFLAIWGIEHVYNSRSIYIDLIIKIAVGATIYILLNEILKNKAYLELKKLILARF
ncbi:MOP flippase family protein [Alteromonas stellipolaris]|uniref:MOP flippase family protein n=1 Tax=Alteromonas stellipolaris TaxID=233316 RepID=UPI0027363C84|nr:MOP flippase family protein [Alteromonas stellipolaris]MDP2537247.1 MOP flippase family protein [Alteromonas stellipolaris]